MCHDYPPAGRPVAFETTVAAQRAGNIHVHDGIEEAQFIAMRTTRRRLGSAGIMLPHYSAFKVAEQFRVLDALAPGRIDLGLGRAPGSDGRTSQLLNPDRYASERFPQQVAELQAELPETDQLWT
jgi:alkanesulfonate monooxygenase SsuD/methylene tetrahydromethanopterin reductase-like flavin-dependent oxidoreductase (luciferase family)